ncbi:MAG: hypothetical protein ABMB14_25950 [Myxococcota bacterium]
MIRIGLLTAIGALAGCQEYAYTAPPVVSIEPVAFDLDIARVVDETAQHESWAKSDVLFVVDSSGSMEDDQQSLITAFPAFMDYFLTLTELDYHIGVIDTDWYLNAGRLRETNGMRWVDRTVVDPVPMFQTLALVGILGSGDEMSQQNVWEALETQRDDWNAGFLREDAFLSVIVISDEDDSSVLAGMTTDTFVSWLTGLKYEPGSVIYSTVVGPVPDGCATAVPGYVHVDTNQRIGGVDWSICDGRWEELLAELAEASSGLKSEFFLTQQPLIDSIVVYGVDGGQTVNYALDTDYTFDPIRNSILFGTPPAPAAKVYIEYDVDPGAQH